MTDRHVIVGAGAVGSHLAQLLVDRGSDVVVVTRSGAALPGTQSQKADASDADQLASIAAGADVLYNCANPSDYAAWPEIWPPLAASLLSAAERSGAVLAITGNLYPYGPVDVPMTEDLPDLATDTKGALRAAMWADALAAHEAGRLRAVEARGSDYVGAGVGDNGHVSRVLPAAMRGKNVRVIGSAHQPHTWTDVLDVARTLIAAAEDAGAHGRVWHVPSNPPRTQNEAINDVLVVAGKGPVKVSAVPNALLGIASKFSPLVREVNDMRYQFTRPYVLNDSAARMRFDIEPTGWDEVCARTAAQSA